MSPSGAGDSNDTSHLPMCCSSGDVGGLRASTCRAGPDLPLLSRANLCLGCSGRLRSRTAPAAQGGVTPASSSSTQGNGESPWPWGMACSYFFPPQKAGHPPPKSTLRDKQGSCKGGITCGRWYCTTGLIPVTGDPWMPSGCFCPDSSTVLLEEKAEGEDTASLPQSSPYCPGSCL